METESEIEIGIDGLMVASADDHLDIGWEYSCGADRLGGRCESGGGRYIVRLTQSSAGGGM